MHFTEDDFENAILELFREQLGVQSQCDTRLCRTALRGGTGGYVAADQSWSATGRY